MIKIWTEEQVTLENLALHLKDSGVIPTAIADDGIWLRTSSGIAYRISILDDKKFLRIGTCLPTNKAQSIDRKLQFEHKLNAAIFLPVFSLDEDDDLHVSYVTPYDFGLIAGQFVSLVNRFGSLLEYLVEERDEEKIIDFGFPTSGDAAGDDHILCH